MPSKRALLQLIEREVIRCRPVALRYFRSRRLRVERKPDRSPVTAADRAIEERLRRAIARAFPGDAILGEEFGLSGRGGSAYWTVDPIDGTRAFSRGLPFWGVMVGRVERGQAVLGVCDFPMLGTTMAAAVGVEAYERSGGRTTPLARPRAVRSIRDAVIFHDGAGWWQSGRFARGFARLVRACYLERAYGDCYGYLWALRGRADAVIDYGLKPWDVVPLAALAEATGRVLTDFSGRPTLSGPESVMAAPSLARGICRILSGSSARRRYG